MYKKITNLSNLVKDSYEWRDFLAKISLLSFGIFLWHKELVIVASVLLILTWILCDGLSHLKSIIREPLMLTILFFCIVLLLGTFWGEIPGPNPSKYEGPYSPISRQFRWAKYMGLMLFIPYLQLLNKKNLPWAVSGLVVGYLGVLFAGIYYQFFLGITGIPPLKMLYLHFSAALGVGILLTMYLANSSINKKVKLSSWGIGFFLLLLQLNIVGRGPILATIGTLFLLLFLLHRRRLKKMLSLMLVTTICVMTIAYHSHSFKQRFSEVITEIEQSAEGKNRTSTGERIALLKVGLYAIAQQPWFGYGTGMAKQAFKENASIYQNGQYKDVESYHHLHFHNDLIELGVYLGGFGVAIYIFLLWGWFQTLWMRKLGALGATLVCFIFLGGITDTFLFYQQITFMLLALTAIVITSRETKQGDFLLENSLSKPCHDPYKN